MSATEILIVDNDEAAVCAIATRLSFAGYTCVTAQSGLQAIAAYDSKRTALVITDLNMPNGSGLDLIHSIREQADTPIIAISGYYESFEQHLAEHMEIVVFKKPFEPGALQDLVELELTPPNTQAA